MLSRKHDIPVSFVCSVVIHGAVAAGFFGAFVVAPRISLAGGSGSIDVSIVSGSEIQSGESAVAPVSAQAPLPSAKLATAKVISAARWERAEPEIRAAFIPRAPLPKSSTTTSSAAQFVPIAFQSGNAPNGGSNFSQAGSGGGLRQGSSVLRAPKPPYPWAARRAGFEGKVELDVAIDSAGAVKDAAVVQSSGREDCDASARNTILEDWKFEPATFLGQPISWKERVVVVYSLQD